MGMTKKGPLLPIYLLLNLYLPLIYLGYVLATERADIYAVLFFFVILPIYSIYGTILMHQTFPTHRLRQLWKFLPLMFILIFNGVTFGSELLSSALASATVLFLMMTVIFFFGVMVLMIKKMRSDAPGQKVAKWFVFLLIFTPSIILSNVIYSTGFDLLALTRDITFAHFTLITQVAGAIVLSFPTFVTLYKQKRL